MFFWRFEAVRLLARGLGLGLVGAVVALLLGHAGALESLERGSSNALFRLRGPRQPRSKIVLLVVDEATVTRAGRMPLPRRFYAQSVQRLRGLGARVIAFDFVFGTASDDPKQDALVAREVGATRGVTQGIIFDAPGASADPRALSLLPACSLPERGAGGRIAGARIALSVAAPRRAMMAPQGGVGHLNFRPEPGGEVRRIPHLIRFEGKLYPSLALSAAMLSQSTSSRAPHLSGWTAMPGQIAAPAGDIEVPIDESGETLVNWLGGDGTFPTFSMLQLLDGRVPRRAIQGATVMIGSARVGSFSPLSTPFSAPIYNNQSALHLQANAFDDIVSNRILRPLSPLLQIGIALAFSLAAGALIAPRGALGALGWGIFWSLMLWALALALLFFNISCSIAAPQIALVLTGALCLGVRQRREAGELRLMQDLFGGYVGDEVLRLIKTKNPKPKLDGELRHVAILFCDIRGFSGLAEGLRHEPEKLLFLLNDHFEPLIHSLQAHGGHVDNFAGDLVMAMFGAPLHEQSADRSTRNAVLAALDVLRIVAQRNEQRQQSGEPRIEVGVGVHCGPAVVGDLGIKRRKHYTAIGDTVNIASRVEGETRVYRTGFLVTEDVVFACRDHPDTHDLEWRFVADAAVRGRQSAVKLFSLPEFDE